MKSVLLVAALLAVAFLVNAKTPHPAEAGSQYKDGIYKFSINPPDLGKADGMVKPVMFFGPEVDGFQANVNVMVQPGQPGPDEYVETTKKFVRGKQGKFVVARQLQVSGHDAEIMEYAVHLGERDLHFLALAVFIDTKVYLTTCTDTENQFESHRDAFQKCVDSFALNP